MPDWTAPRTSCSTTRLRSTPQAIVPGIIASRRWLRGVHMAAEKDTWTFLEE